MGFVSTVIMLYIPAGTLHYPNGWLFICVLFVPMFIAGLIMMKNSPELLEKRLDMREEEPEQKGVIVLSGLMFVLVFVSAGLSFRFVFMTVPMWVSLAASFVFILGYILYGVVLYQNEYLSRTVKVQKNQKVIDTGTYSAVRHPMYSATLIMFLSIGPVLGSVISFIVSLVYIPIIIVRILNEEKLLEKELDGYLDYEKKVRYRIIPGIW